MEIRITPRALKALENLPRQTRLRVVTALDTLAVNPYLKAKKLTGQPGYRVRVGDYRVLFIVDRPRELIFIVRIRHRRDAYR